MDMTSPEMKEILEATSLVHRGDKAAGRARLLELWDKYSAQGQALQLCSLAHILADTEAGAADELEWDLRALETAIGTREAVDQIPAAPIPESFLPSLHLSVAEGYRRLGDLERARRHVEIAANHIGTLLDDAYGNLVRGGLRRLQGLLAA